jgi:alpha-L-fucosidase
MDFQSAQINELLTQYGPIGEVWIDIPSVLPRNYRQELYDQIAGLQPQTVIMLNNGIGDGSNYPIAYAWPADIIAIERFLPNSHTGHVKLREIEGKKYYMPGEVCDPIGRDWFFTEDDQPRSDNELLGMYLVSISRGTNLLLDVGPDRHGLIPGKFVKALHLNSARDLDKRLASSWSSLPVRKSLTFLAFIKPPYLCLFYYRDLWVNIEKRVRTNRQEKPADYPILDQDFPNSI